MEASAAVAVPDADAAVAAATNNTLTCNSSPSPSSQSDGGWTTTEQGSPTCEEKEVSKQAPKEKARRTNTFRLLLVLVNIMSLGKGKMFLKCSLPLLQLVV